MPENKKSLAESVASQLSILGLLVLFVGIVTIESYSQYFGISYYYFNYQIFHLFYLGLKIIIYKRSLLFVYFITIILINIDLKEKLLFFKIMWSQVLSYFVIIFLLILSFQFAREAGYDSAKYDTITKTTRLPKIELLMYKGNNVASELVDWRLLVNTNNYVICFITYDGYYVESPKLFYYEKGEVNEIRTKKTFR